MTKNQKHDFRGCCSFIQFVSATRPEAETKTHAVETDVKSQPNKPEQWLKETWFVPYCEIVHGKNIIYPEIIGNGEGNQDILLFTSLLTHIAAGMRLCKLQPRQSLVQYIHHRQPRQQNNGLSMVISITSK